MEGLRLRASIAVGVRRRHRRVETTWCRGKMGWRNVAMTPVLFFLFVWLYFSSLHGFVLEPSPKMTEDGVSSNKKGAGRRHGVVADARPRRVPGPPPLPVLSVGADAPDADLAGGGAGAATAEHQRDQAHSELVELRSFAQREMGAAERGPARSSAERCATFSWGRN